MKYFFSTIFIAIAGFSLAQREQHVDLDLNYRTNSLMITGNVVKNFKLLKSEKLHLGVGVRLGYFIGKDVSFLTAPAKYTKIENGIDTLLISNPWLMNVNLSLNASYHLNKQWSLGGSIDAIGFSFGPQSESQYYPGLASQSEIPARKTLLHEKVKPTLNNFLAFGDYTKGAINANIYVRYTHNQRYSYKLGYNQNTTEFSTINRVGHKENNRFRHSTGLILLGFGYSFI